MQDGGSRDGGGPGAQSPGWTAEVTETDRQAAEAAVVVSRWAIHRRLYDWVIGFAHHRHAAAALFGLSFIESSFFPIPPDVLLAPLCLSNRRRAVFFATVCTVASVLGAFLGYAIGTLALETAVSIGIPGVTAERVAWLQGEFVSRGNIYVFIAALTPIPFKLLTITAGAAQMNLGVFAIACILGRASRFYAVALVFWLVGPKAMPFIDRYFNLLCVVFTVLLIGGFYALKFMH